MEINQNIKISHFVYPNDKVLEEKFHIYIDISAQNLELPNGVAENVNALVFRIKELIHLQQFQKPKL